jgi:hypothetical protein
LINIETIIVTAQEPPQGELNCLSSLQKYPLQKLVTPHEVSKADYSTSRIPHQSSLSPKRYSKEE